MKKIIALILALIMMLVFASCGSVKGEQKTWGNISVFVPEKYSLNGGSLANDNDKNQCTIKPEQSTNMYDYFIVAITNAKNALSNIESTKSVNNAEDVTVKVGDTEWKGCKYLFLCLFYRRRREAINFYIVVVTPVGYCVYLFGCCNVCLSQQRTDNKHCLSLV